MSNITLVGIDLSKHVFELRMENHVGSLVCRKSVYREDLMESVVKLVPRGACIAMEACGGSNYWGSRFKAEGYEVRLIPPQFVKPYRRSQKNDRNDSEAICEAARRPNMRFVPLKREQELELQALHRARERYMSERTALVNQTRGLLMEKGIVIPVGILKFQKVLPEIVQKLEQGKAFRELIAMFWFEYKELCVRIKLLDSKLKQECKSNSRCAQLQKEVKGVGVVVATAVVATMGDPKAYKNGRNFAASLGLVPKQYSTGGKPQLGSITKRGDRYVRAVIVQGARSAVIHALKCKEPKLLDLWIRELYKRRGANRCVVAVANKNARKMWAILAGKSPYENKEAQQPVQLAA